MKRNIKYIIVHCTATLQSATVESIKKYWKEVKCWNSPGYHYLIKADGEVVVLLNEDEVSNGCQGYNHNSINVCYIGGVDSKNISIDNRTEAQRKALLEVLSGIKARHPDAKIISHRDLNPHKDCPSFCATKEYEQI